MIRDAGLPAPAGGKPFAVCPLCVELTQLLTLKVFSSHPGVVSRAVLSISHRSPLISSRLRSHSQFSFDSAKYRNRYSSFVFLLSSKAQNDVLTRENAQHHTASVSSSLRRCGHLHLPNSENELLTRPLSTVSKQLHELSPVLTLTLPTLPTPRSRPLRNTPTITSHMPLIRKVSNWPIKSRSYRKMIHSELNNMRRKGNRSGTRQKERERSER